MAHLAMQLYFTQFTTEWKFWKSALKQSYYVITKTLWIPWGVLVRQSFIIIIIIIIILDLAISQFEEQRT